MNQLKVCLIGGTGFVGTWLINALAGLGHQIKVISRRPERHAHLKTVPGIKITSIDFFGSKILERQIDTYDVVVNLAGILNPVGKNSFERVHVDVTKRIAEAAELVATPRILHMSALHADVNGPSEYLRTKGKAQKIILAAKGPAVTSFAPSVIFGPGDSFFNRFAGLLKMAPGYLPLACGSAKFAPIYVGDVVDAFINAIDKPETYKKNYPLCGPSVYSLKELVQYTALQIEQDKAVISLPRSVSKLMALLMTKLPGTPLTLDNFNSMKIDSICSRAVAQELGLKLRSVESVVPGYLSSSSDFGKRDFYRSQASR